MDKRTLGSDGLEVSAIGLGCMSMTGGYSDRPDRQEMISLIRTAVDRGVTFFDTAEIYGPYVNEELVGEALAPHKGQVVIATKFGWDIDPVERKPRGRVTSCPDTIKQVVEGSLPGKSPWRGYWRRSLGSFRSLAPAGCTALRKTSAQPMSSSRLTNSQKSRTPRPRSRCRAADTTRPRNK
jgi:Aldo/keto reductase family